MADPHKAVLIASATDCNGRVVSGAQLDRIDDATNAPIVTGSEPRQARPAYNHLALPGSSRTFTTAEQPAWVLANAPVNIDGATKTHGYRLRVQGRMRESAAQPVIFAEGEVELLGAVITRIDTLPRVLR